MEWPRPGSYVQEAAHRWVLSSGSSPGCTSESPGKSFRVHMQTLPRPGKSESWGQGPG